MKQSTKQKQRQPQAIAGAPVFLTPDQVCASLGINRAKLLQLEGRGVLTPVRLGHATVRFRASDLEKLATDEGGCRK
jgi:excisionase family DNA binding protein